MRRSTKKDALSWKPIAGVIMVLVGLYATQNPDQFRWIGDAVFNFARGVSEDAQEKQEWKRQNNQRS